MIVIKRRTFNSHRPHIARGCADESRVLYPYQPLGGDGSWHLVKRRPWPHGEMADPMGDLKKARLSSAVLVLLTAMNSDLRIAAVPILKLLLDLPSVKAVPGLRYPTIW